MQNILAKIRCLGSAYTGKSADSEAIILCQRRLLLNRRPAIPADYLELLHAFNSLSYDGSHLFGIRPRPESDLDILYENALIELPEPGSALVLGLDEMEYLIWNNRQKSYQTIDKDSFQVLNTYKTCETALLDFLKLSDDNQYLR